MWAVRIRLQIADRARDLALFNLAIDSKLRGCDLVALRVDDVLLGGRARPRATVVQRKTGRPVQFEISEQTREAVARWIERGHRCSGDFLFPSRVGGGRKPITTRHYARLMDQWVASVGLDARLYGTHSLRRTKVALIYRRTGNLRAVQLLLGHTKIESTVRYLGVEVDDALAISEAVDISAGRRAADQRSQNAFPVIPDKSYDPPMSVRSHARHSLPPAERPGGARGAAALRAAAERGPAARAELRVARGDGTEEALSLPPSALPALAELLEGLATAEAVTVFAGDAELTPEEAAGVLGISRPLVRRRMDAGLLPFRRVGAHRRVRLADVLALRAREADRRAAMAELAADAEDLERTHGL